MVVMTLLSRASSKVVVEVVERQPRHSLLPTPPRHIHPPPLPALPRPIHLHHPPPLPLLRAVIVLVFHPGNLLLLCVSHIEILCSNNQVIPPVPRWQSGHLQRSSMGCEVVVTSRSVHPFLNVIS